MRRLVRALRKPLLVTIVSIIATSAPASAIADAQSARTACPAVQFIGVRGSSEAQGLGATVGAAYASFRTHSRVRSNSWALVYPAATVPLPGNEAQWSAFLASVDAGVASLNTYLVAEATKCPSQHFVLAGYSQGALVVDSTLEQLPSELVNRIDGVTLFGDPQWRGEFTHNIGTGDPDADGVARELLVAYWGADYVPPAFVDKTRSYCLAGDVVCNFSMRNMWSCSHETPDAVCPHGTYVRQGLTEAAGVFLSSQVNSLRFPAPPAPVPAPAPPPASDPWVTVLSTLGL